MGMDNMRGQHLLVVGGGAMGGHVCREAALRGADVYFTYNRNAGNAEKLAAQIEEERLAGYCQLDISDPSAVADRVKQAVVELGGVEALVISAGYVHHMIPLEAIDFGEVEKTIAVELTGVIATVKEVLPHMRETGYGRIVLVGSDSGKVGSKGEAASSAARGGIIAFAKALARETAGDDICVNVICPGPTESPLLDGLLSDQAVTGKLTRAMMRAIPKRRAARTDEIAAATLFLASPEAGYITGQALSVSGGLTMS
jgi:2-hydroxycyclohexanecarboxyl-CoA dehydrogenase